MDNANNAKTLKDHQDQIIAYVKANFTTPSVFTAWEPVEMRFQNDKKTHLAPHSEIERAFQAGKFAPADMFVLKALNAFTYAPTECVLALLKYWYKQEMTLADEEHRQRLCIPNYGYFNDLWNRLSDLTHDGLVAKLNFYPQFSKPGREGRTESVFKVGAYGVSLYRKVLNEKGMPYNPIEAYCNVEDIFAYCLNAYAICPFLYSPYLKDIQFKVTEQINKRDHKSRCIMTFNTDGKNGDETNDTDVIFEGVTFHTNEAVVTAQSRKDTIIERIKELAAIYGEHSKKRPTYIIFNCEDAVGVKQLSSIIQSEASEIIDRCFFTTGNVIVASNSLYAPEHLRNCFLGYERNAQTDQVRLTGASGYYFLNIDPLAISIDTPI